MHGADICKLFWFCSIARIAHIAEKGCTCSSTKTHASPVRKAFSPRALVSTVLRSDESATAQCSRSKPFRTCDVEVCSLTTRQERA